MASDETFWGLGFSCLCCLLIRFLLRSSSLLPWACPLKLLVMMPCAFELVEPFAYDEAHFWGLRIALNASSISVALVAYCFWNVFCLPHEEPRVLRALYVCLECYCYFWTNFGVCCPWIFSLFFSYFLELDAWINLLRTLVWWPDDEEILRVWMVYVWIKWFWLCLSFWTVCWYICLTGYQVGLLGHGLVSGRVELQAWTWFWGLGQDFGNA